MVNQLNINRKSYVLRSIPLVSTRIFFILLALYWVYRAIIIKAHNIFLFIGIFFLVWSLSSILFPLFTPLKKIYFMKENKIFLYDYGIFKRSIPLDKIINCEVKKMSYFDKKFNTYRAEITVGDDYEDYFELYGLKSDSQLLKITKKFPKNIKKTLKKEQKKTFSLDFFKNIKKSELSKRIIKIIIIILVVILIIFLIKTCYSRFDVLEEMISSEQPPMIASLDEYDKNKIKEEIPLQNKWLFFGDRDSIEFEFVKDKGSEYYNFICRKDMCHIFNSETDKKISLDSIYSSDSPIWIRLEKGDYIFAITYEGCPPNAGNFLALNKKNEWFDMNMLAIGCQKEFSTKYYEFSIKEDVKAISFHYGLPNSEVIMVKEIKIIKS